MMNPIDITILILMGLAAVISAGSFSAIMRTLFDRGLANPRDRKPDILGYYKTYVAHTRRQIGRIGGTFWVHTVSAAVFILIGVCYTIYRFIIPRFL